MLEKLIDMEILGIYEDCSLNNVCINETHRTLYPMSFRVAGEYHRRCRDDLKCILGTFPEKNDGALRFVFSEYKKALAMPPDDARVLRTRSAPAILGCSSM